MLAWWTRLCLLAFALAVLDSCYSQSLSTHAIVKGSVFDKKSQESIPGVSIYLQNKRLGCIADSSGAFILYVPPGQDTLVFRHVGYQMSHRALSLKPGQVINLEQSLAPQVLEGEEIRISAERFSGKMGQFRIHAPELRDMPSPLPDPIQALQTMPGVYSINDQSHFYSVHGGSYDENLIYLDGFELYQPHLVRKGIAENPSLVNPLLVKSINLHSSAFPVTFGDKMSSVLDITYRDSLKTGLSGIAKIGAIGINAALFYESPNRKTKVLSALRKVRYGYLFGVLQTQGEYSPEFVDWQFTVKQKLNDHWAFQVLGVQALSDYYLLPDNWEYKIFRMFESAYTRSDMRGLESFGFQTRLTGVRFDYAHPNGLQMRWLNSIHEQWEKEDTHISEKIYYLDTILEAPGPDHYKDKSEREHLVDADLHFKQFTSLLTTSYGQAGYRLTAGFEFKMNHTRDEITERQSETNLYGLIYQYPALNYQHGVTRRHHFWSHYIQGRYHLGEKISGSTGVRWLYASVNQEWVMQPRISLRWLYSPESEFSVAIGRYAQPPLYKELQFLRVPEKDLLIQKSDQIVVGAFKKLQPDLEIKIDVFYKKYTDLISYDLRDVRMRYSGYNDAKGYAYGVDVQLRGAFLPGQDNWLSYSYLVTREDLEGDDLGWVPRPTDRRHQISLFMQDAMEEWPNSKFHLRILYGTGYPYTWQRWMLNRDTSTYELAKGKRNHVRMQMYGRFDTGFTQTFILYDKYKLVLRQEVLNVFNHYNVLGFDFVMNRKVDLSLSGRIFNFSAEFEF
jgi:outer membrane receptor protein involved in Fe transport